jgi:hypothetical protein
VKGEAQNLIKFPVISREKSCALNGLLKSVEIQILRIHRRTKQRSSISKQAIKIIQFFPHSHYGLSRSELEQNNKKKVVVCDFIWL